MEQEVIITNHNLLFHFSDPSKKMVHTFLRMNSAVDSVVLERDQKRDQAKSLPSNSI